MSSVAMAMSSEWAVFCRMYFVFLIQFLAHVLLLGIQMAVGKEDMKVSGKLPVRCVLIMKFSISLTVVVGVSYSTIRVFWISEVWRASQRFGRV